VSHLGPRTEGYATEILADLGAEVEPGDLLAVLESPEVGAVRADLTESRTVLEIAEENYARIVRLEAQGITSRRDVLDAQADLRRAEAALLRAEQELAALGATEGEGADFFVRAPFAGVVVERHAVRGEVVGPTDRMFTVAELDHLWIELDIYERDLSRVAVGQRVVVMAPAVPAKSFEGEVAYLAGILDPVRRTVDARVNVANPARDLRP
jgi:cobalt-zinc-cadmium efflux system membrane fusion protein